VGVGARLLGLRPKRPGATEADYRCFDMLLSVFVAGVAVCSPSAPVWSSEVSLGILGSGHWRRRLAVPGRSGV
jgi:hypothetical protein